jgi:gluconokinase
MSHLLSIDIGTSGVRAAVFDECGGEVPGTLVSAQRQQGTDFAELDPDLLVAEVVQALDRVSSFPKPIEFIAISTFWHSLLGVDDSGAPTTAVFTWADTRAAKYVEWLRQNFNEAELHTVTGCRFHSSYWPAKLLWLKEEQPNNFTRTFQWLGFAEYLTSRLFGTSSTSVSMASATGLFNQETCEWEASFVESLGISFDTLPSITRDESPQLQSDFRERWPALSKARLITVIGDGAANNIGGGCTTKERTALMVGTSGAMRTVYTGGPPASLPPALWSYRVDRRRVVIGGALSDGGGLFRWLKELTKLENAEELEAQLEALPPNSHGLTVLPFWSGERSTGWSTNATGGILGLTQATTPVELIRAALESIAYRFALIARDLDSIAPNSHIVATGNALRSSPVWLQILTDTLGRSVSYGGFQEASLRGAALLALESVGKIGSIEEVKISVDQVLEPDMSCHALYQEGLARQQALYERLFAIEHKETDT